MEKTYFMPTYGDPPKYYGITYPSIFRFKIIRYFWRHFLCRRNIHCFDEVLSGARPWCHYLVCDCCQLIIDIDKIDETYYFYKEKENERTN